MRTLLVMIGFLVAAPLYGQERTWTIARDVFTTKAELVAVRGEIAYLKIGGKVEEFPLIRLSAADQRYIASLPLAPILPGPGDEAAASDLLPTPVAGVAGGAARPAEASLLRVTPPANAQAAEEALPLPPGPIAGANMQAGAKTQAAGGRTSNFRATNAQSLNTNSLNNTNNTNARRYAAQQQQQQQAQVRRTTSGQQNQQEPLGILGIRSRRADRQRGR